MGVLVALTDPVPEVVELGRGGVAEEDAPTDIVPVAVFVGVIVCVIVTEGDFVTRAVTVVLMVLDVVLLAVWEGVLEGVIVPEAVLVAVPVPVWVPVELSVLDPVSV